MKQMRIENTYLYVVLKTIEECTESFLMFSKDELWNDRWWNTAHKDGLDT